MSPSYRREILHKSEALEVITCYWQQDSHSREHSHGGSSCVVLVQEGVFENEMKSGYATDKTTVSAGEVIATPVGSLHQLRCVSETGKTLHFYSPGIPSDEKIATRTFSAPARESLRNQAFLGLQDQGIKFSELEQIFRLVEKQSISTASPFFMNQLFSGVLAESILAESYVSKNKTTLATYEASPAFTAIELEVISKIGSTIGWTKCEGVSVPGGSSANFMALHLARHSRFPEIKSEGMGNLRFAIFVSDQAHYSYRKGTAVLGLGLNSIFSVKTDSEGSMLPSDLVNQIKRAEAEGRIPLMVGATSGTTVLGAFDPLDEIGEICSSRGLWFHVDAAWGGPVLFSPQLKHLMRGVHLADSLTFDGHKLFGASLTSSFFLTSRPNLLRASNDVSGTEYLFHQEETIDLGRLSWQCGKRADAVSFWAIWKRYGTQGLAAFVDRQVSVRNEVISYIRTQPQLRLAHTPSFLNLCVYVDPSTEGSADSSHCIRIREELIARNIAMINYSLDQQGHSFLRLIFANPDLTGRNVIEMLESALNISKELRA
jgi:sulfinoalanine decarboxylase